MRGKGGVLVGIRLLDLGGARHLPGELRAQREELADEGGDGGFRERMRRDDQVIDADGVDLVFRPRR